MKCPYCRNSDTKVVDSRTTSDRNSIRRRRECLKCKKRFTTYERMEEITLTVVKKDNCREPFDRNKILVGIRKACEKRPIGLEKIESLVNDIEKTLENNLDREVCSSEIGKLVMEKLHDLDEVAYVRFASVYRQFKDVTQFVREAQRVRRRAISKKLFPGNQP